MTHLHLMIEVAAMGLVAVVAWGFAAPFRSWYRQEEKRPATLGGALCGIAARTLFAATVWVLSWAIWVLARRALAEAAWLPECAKHVKGWLLFWAVVFVLALVEGVAIEAWRLRGRRFPVPELLRNLIRAAVLLAAVFAILRLELGVNISPLLASTALVTAVVGFALQGVLGNLLAGMSLHVVGSLMPSDWVAIDGVEGEVVQTNWRETRLRTTGGHLVILPNSTVAAARIHNMSRPTPVRRHEIHVAASYSDAPGDVIAALREAAAAVPGVLCEPAPSAYVTEYKDFGIDYVLRFWSRQYHNRTPLEGDVGRMIWYQFKRRGIEIPFPMSDKLLNDFMQVVFTQRRLAADEEEVERRVRDLQKSDFVPQLLADEAGRALLSSDQLREVARHLRRLRYTSGEVVFRQGDSGETCYVVTGGRLRGRMEERAGGVAHEFEIGPGALFGEMSLLSGLPRTATLVAVDEVEVLEISKGAFARLLSLREDIPQILSGLVADRAAKNAEALQRLRAMELAQVTETIRRENILQRFFRMLGR